MKSLILILVMLLSACASQPKTAIVEPAPVAKVVAFTTRVIVGENFQYTAPATLQPTSREASTAFDESSKLLVITKVGPIPADVPLHLFVQEMSNRLENSGFAPTALPQRIVWLGINNPGAYLVVSHNNLTIFIWLGLADGQGAAFSCGGLTSDKTRNERLCSAMADSFTLLPHQH